jgi:UDP-N-acetyl-D-galactosamine dehydrogenase
MSALPSPAERLRIAVVGLGYVGLPLMLALARAHDVIGYDVDAGRVGELKARFDRHGQFDAEHLGAIADRVSASTAVLAARQVYILTVPTPVTDTKQPDLSALEQACRAVGAHLRPGAVVVIESTVYPGCTEEYCVPILEAVSGLRLNRDFRVGYSPERLSPGRGGRPLEAIVKLTSGSDPAAAEFVDALYRAIVPAGTHRCASIRVAEAAKALENVQRDVNIALMNEFAMIAGALGVDTGEVLAAARTKWNFLPFEPGLVGGHCIGVDPYYLISRAQQAGQHADLISAARRVNEAMPRYLVDVLQGLLARAGRAVYGARVLILGLAFKENCADLRNTRVLEIVARLRALGAEVEVMDPLVDAADAARQLGAALLIEAAPASFDAVVLAVAHQEFLELGSETLRSWLRPGGVLYDVKRVLPPHAVSGRL